MPQDSIEYAVPEDLQASQLVARLRAGFNIRHQSDSSIIRMFYDTFDWRLYKHGAVLEMQRDERTNKVYWRPGKRDKLKIQLAVRGVPALAAALPDSSFRRQLQSLIGPRELMPRIDARVSRRLYGVLDDNDKVVVRIVFDDCWVSPSKTRADRLVCRRLTLKPVKGFAEDFREVKTLLESSGLNATHDRIMRQALSIKGIKAGDYNTRVSPRLDPDSTPLQASRLILLELLEIMQHNTPGIIKGKDTEYLHDFRIALLKSGSLIGLLQQSGILVDILVDKACQKHFATLDALTLPVRKLDRFIYRLTDYMQQIDPGKQKPTQRLLESLQTYRATAQGKLVDKLSSSAYKKSVSQWKSYLRSQRSTEAADKTALEWADETAWSVFEESKKHGNAYKKNQKEENRRLLEQSFNRLNQLMEFFQSYYSMLTVREMSGLLTGLTDDLETLGELSTQIDMLGEHIQKHTDDEDHHADAYESLLAYLRQQSDVVSEHFASLYPNYSAAKTRKTFKDMFIDYHMRQDSEEDSDL